MKLCIRQRVFSWGDTYDVYDESGEPRYFVKAEVFAFGHQIHVFDKRGGQEVGSIHQKLFVFLPEFEIVIGGAVRGTIRKEFSFFVPRYHVDFQNWDVEGDFMNWDYSASRNGREVVSISKQLFTWGDTYVIEYQDIGDEIPALMLAIAIDAVNCSND